MAYNLNVSFVIFEEDVLQRKVRFRHRAKYQCMYKVKCMVILFDGQASLTQSLLLVLCSGITPDGAQKIICDASMKPVLLVCKTNVLISEPSLFLSPILRVLLSVYIKFIIEGMYNKEAKFLLKIKVSC